MLNSQDRRSQGIAKDFVRKMRARGHSRKEVLEMIDLAKNEICSSEAEQASQPHRP